MPEHHSDKNWFRLPTAKEDIYIYRERDTYIVAIFVRNYSSRRLSVLTIVGDNVANGHTKFLSHDAAPQTRPMVNRSKILIDRRPTTSITKDMINWCCAQLGSGHAICLLINLSRFRRHAIFKAGAIHSQGHSVAICYKSKWNSQSHYTALGFE